MLSLYILQPTSNFVCITTSISCSKMSDVAETVVAQEPEVIEPSEEQPTKTEEAAATDDVVVIEKKTEEQ